MYDLRHLVRACELFCVSARIEMAPNLPVVGRDAFSTSTGTHAAAIRKARRMGREFEDLIYSAVSADELDRGQTLLIGPNSGRSTIRAVLEEMSIPATDETISALLHHCKEHDRCLESADEILALLPSAEHCG
jgi:isopropylmalate/homocitrate/citramalate synthase